MHGKPCSVRWRRVERVSASRPYKPSCAPRVLRRVPGQDAAARDTLSPQPAAPVITHNPFGVGAKAFGGLTFLPSLVLGPIADQFQVAAQTVL